MLGPGVGHFVREPTARISLVKQQSSNSATPSRAAPRDPSARIRAPLVHRPTRRAGPDRRRHLLQEWSPDQRAVAALRARERSLTYCRGQSRSRRPEPAHVEAALERSTSDVRVIASAPRGVRASRRGPARRARRRGSGGPHPAPVRRVASRAHSRASSYGASRSRVAACSRIRERRIASARRTTQGAAGGAAVAAYRPAGVQRLGDRRRGPPATLAFCNGAAAAVAPTASAGDEGDSGSRRTRALGGRNPLSVIAAVQHAT